MPKSLKCFLDKTRVCNSVCASYYGEGKAGEHCKILWTVIQAGYKYAGIKNSRVTAKKKVKKKK